MFLFLNGSEFRQKLIGTIIRVLVRHLRAVVHSPASNYDKDQYEVKCHIIAQCAPPHQRIQNQSNAPLPLNYLKFQRFKLFR